ncbi:MAG: DUF3267 domain-containing protein [Clostridia bacterium]|nr:DUF3267 domain-containing protein [Clostridia bacterium]
MEYKKKLIAFNIKKADNFAVILFFVSFVLFGAINLFDKRTPVLTTGSVWFDSLLALGIFVVGMFAHEGLHALSGMAFGKLKPSQIKFGFDLRGANLYTHFDSPMPIKGYIATVIMPCVITALIPIALLTALGGIIPLGAACLLFAGCAGDIIMFFSAVKQDKNALVSDHPTALAYYLVYPENAVPDGFSETTEEEETALLAKAQNKAFESEKAKKRSIMSKCLGILVFLALYVLVMYLVSLTMQFI